MTYEPEVDWFTGQSSLPTSEQFKGLLQEMVDAAIDYGFSKSPCDAKEHKATMEKARESAILAYSRALARIPN